jgi:hypothetical protein
MLVWQKSDEKLKREQLKLSKKHKWVEMPDIGHHVIRDAPSRVAAEVRWVMQRVSDGSSSNAPSSRRTSTDVDEDKENRRGSESVAADGKDHEKRGFSSWLRRASAALTQHKDQRPSS